MWLVLGQDNDIEARWVAAGLRARADRPVALVSAAMLVHDCRWEHRVGVAGASSRLVLGDGTVLDPTTVDGVVNRLCWLGAEGFAGASARDREYATGELNALGLSWLESLGGRVVNRMAEWRGLARTVGLPVAPYDSDEPEVTTGEADRVVLVLDGEVIEGGGPTRPGPELTPAGRDALAALQRASGLDLLGVHLVTGERLVLRSASFLPSMSLFGAAGLDALHKALMNRRGAGR